MKLKYFIEIPVVCMSKKINELTKSWQNLIENHKMLEITLVREEIKEQKKRVKKEMKIKSAYSIKGL